MWVRWRRGCQVVCALVLLAGCAPNSCSSLKPLDGPLPRDVLTPQVIQTKVTAQGLTYIGEKLPAVVSSFVQMSCDGQSGIPCATGQTCECPPGQTCQSCPSDNPFCQVENPRICQSQEGADPVIGFRIPPSDSDITDVCTERLGANWSNCVVHATLHRAEMVPRNDYELEIQLHVDINTPAFPNGIKIAQQLVVFEAKCDVYPHITDRTISAVLRVARELNTDRMSLEVTQVDVPFTGADITLGGDLTCAIADLGFFKDFIIGSFAPRLSEQVKDALNKALAPVRFQPCTPGASYYQCPARPQEFSSSCTAESICTFDTPDHKPVPGLLGFEGKLDLSTALEGLLTPKEPVQLSLYAGGTREDGNNADYLANGGLYIGMVGGARSSLHSCVAPRQLPQGPVPEFQFTDAVAPANGGDPVPYMVGLAVHTRFLNDVLGESYNSGLLCQEISSQSVNLVQSGIIGLLIGETQAIENLVGQSSPARPVLMEMHPRAEAQVQMGLGTTGPDPEDASRTILVEPLLTISIPELDLDIYTLVDDRLVRLLTLTLDLAIGLGLELNGQDQLHVIANPVDTWIQAVRVRNADALAHSADEIAASVPEMIGAILPRLAPTLDQMLDMPSMQGFQLSNVRFKGVQPTSSPTALGKTRYEFLGVFSDLSFVPTGAHPLSIPLETFARVVEVLTPSVERMKGPAESRERTRVVLAVDTTVPQGAEAEHSYRIDGGLWHPYQRGDVLVLSDPEFNLQGWHTVEVRSRLVGRPRTLDATPAAVTVLSDAEPPVLDARWVNGQLKVHVWDRVTNADNVLVRFRGNHGGWVELPGGKDREVALPEVFTQGALDVEARDQAGRASLVHLPALTPPGISPLKPSQPASSGNEGSPSCGGCAASGGLPPFLASLACALLLLRRKTRRHPR